MNLPWLDKEEYPFRANFIKLDMGRMHYVDEGSGEPVVMCHGNPTWSFLYRHLIKGLSPHYRCVAMDYIGFGLSDKPPTWSYLPHEQACNVESLIDRLGLNDPSFKARELKRFQSIFSNFRTIRFDRVGHFVQEEKKAELLPFITEFIAAAEQPEMVMA